MFYRVIIITIDIIYDNRKLRQKVTKQNKIAIWRPI